MRQRTGPQGSKPRPPLIYIVDDEPLLLDLAEASLAPGGFTVKKFSDPEEALNAFAKARPKPDVLVTDYAMGKMNGVDLLKKCRALCRDLRGVLISGTVGAEVVLDAPTKVDRFIGKPYQPQSLLELVRRVLAERDAP